MKSKYLTIGGLSALSVTFITNFGFADVSSDRLDTYKANKLIPNEVQIATINSVSSESAGVAVFSPDVLSWKSYSNASSAALGKYMDWTREDFEAFFADRANASGFEDAWNFLSQTGNDHLQGATISDEDALIVLQAQLDALVSSAPVFERSVLIQRLGLRYVSHIIPSNDDSIDSYIHEGFRINQASVFGTAEKICTISQAGEVNIYGDKKGIIVFRITQGEKGLFLPPDLLPNPPKHILATIIAIKAPIKIIQLGIVEGKLYASRSPVITAEKFWVVLAVFSQ